jgi:DNA repair ATPase RecN
LASGDIIEDKELGVLSSTVDDATLKEKYGFDSNSLASFYTQLDKDAEKLKEFGEEIEANNAAIKASYEAMATQAEQLANLS